MSYIQDIKSWSWVVLYWLFSYAVILTVGIGVASATTLDTYWIVYLIGVPLLVAPVTYRQLVGGGCSLRFQICALVKGALVGMIFFIIALLVDPYVWKILDGYLGWNALSLSNYSEICYQIWFFAGTAGGFAARIVEVRQFRDVGQISIAGFE